MDSERKAPEDTPEGLIAYIKEHLGFTAPEIEELFPESLRRAGSLQYAFEIAGITRKGAFVDRVAVSKARRIHLHDAIFDHPEYGMKELFERGFIPHLSFANNGRLKGARKDVLAERHDPDPSTELLNMARNFYRDYLRDPAVTDESLAEEGLDYHLHALGFETVDKARSVLCTRGKSPYGSSHRGKSAATTPPPPPPPPNPPPPPPEGDSSSTGQYPNGDEGTMEKAKSPRILTPLDELHEYMGTLGRRARSLDNDELGRDYLLHYCREHGIDTLEKAVKSRLHGHAGKYFGGIRQMLDEL